MMHFHDVGLTGDIFEDSVEPVPMVYEADRPVIVNLDGAIEKAIADAFDVFAVAAVPVARLEGFDRFDRFESSDSGFQVGGGHPEQVSQCQRQR